VVVDSPEAHVVDALAVFFQELHVGARAVERLEELELQFPQVCEGDADAGLAVGPGLVVKHHAARRDVEEAPRADAEDSRVVLRRSRGVVDHDAHLGDLFVAGVDDRTFGFLS